MAATNQRMIDQHIASKDFCDRLIAVNADNGWWPALKFSGMAEFITTIISDFANVNTMWSGAEFERSLRSTDFDNME